jgi:hypothetical protein
MDQNSNLKYLISFLNLETFYIQTAEQEGRTKTSYC